jgi:hypothetical protein
VLFAVAALGCASNFEPASKLKTLRVLAVQKDKPYARPGDTVHLQMLVSDPRSRNVLDGGRDAGTRELSVGWLAGCENPLADSYQQCIPQFAPPFNYVDGTLDFALTLSPDIISSRPPPANPAQPRYGTSFVFFAACAGKLIPFRPSSTSPFGCVSNTGAPLGANDFVIGYTEVFAYDALTNHNPIIGLNGETTFEVDGNAVVPDCVGDACVALAAEELSLRGPIGGTKPPGMRPADAGLDGSVLLDGSLILDGSMSGGADAASPPGDASPPADAAPPGSGSAPPSVPPPPSCDSDDPRCFDACTTDDQNKCPKHTVNLVVDMSSAESDDVATILQGSTVQEQMWINYYADAGKLEHDVKLLNDATTGWNPEHSADLLAPQNVGTFHVWAVAHDNRGGAQWVRLTLATRTAP